ncbi:MAG: DUF1566 domain-containing protein [Burkholderiaceae bacterium]|nr:DUF1566 domain-containing protein [Burkholderiaceae bacterium]
MKRTMRSFQACQTTLLLKGLLCTFVVSLIGGEALAQSPRFRISADGHEVSDARTALIWRRCLEGMSHSAGGCSGTSALFVHEAALTHAQAESAKTGKNWRVPNIKELSSIADRTRSNPAIDTTLFPHAVGSVGSLWSSTPYSSLAWVMFTHQGELEVNPRQVESAVRLVRSNQ